MNATGRIFACVLSASVGYAGALAQSDNTPPEGFAALFNGKDLSGWGGLFANPPQRAKMTPEQLAQAREDADRDMQLHWSVENGTLVFDGKGHSLMTVREYADFEMLVDWRIEPGGDRGVYLRGSPQVPIWEREEGSGGLYNNRKNPSKPLEHVDHPTGEWNRFRIKMVGERVTVHLNETLVSDNVVMENYWERDKPIYPRGPIELQAHGSRLEFKNIFIREISKDAEEDPPGEPSGNPGTASMGPHADMPLVDARRAAMWVGVLPRLPSGDGALQSLRFSALPPASPHASHKRTAGNLVLRA